MLNLFRSIFNLVIDSNSVEINPSTGLPLVDNTQVDVGGNFFGQTNFHNNDHGHSSFNSFSSFND